MKIELHLLLKTPSGTHRLTKTVELEAIPQAGDAIRMTQSIDDAIVAVMSRTFHVEDSPPDVVAGGAFETDELFVWLGGEGWVIE